MATLFCCDWALWLTQSTLARILSKSNLPCFTSPGRTTAGWKRLSPNVFGMVAFEVGWISTRPYCSITRWETMFSQLCMRQTSLLLLSRCS